MYIDMQIFINVFVMWGGWWKKQTRRVCGAVSPNLSLQVHGRAFDLSVLFFVRKKRKKETMGKSKWPDYLANSADQKMRGQSEN